MVVDGDLADLQYLGNFAVLQPLLVAQAQNLLRELGHVLIDEAMQHLQLFLFAGSLRGNHLYHDGLLQLLLFLLVNEQIDAAVAHAGEQKGLERFRAELGATMQQMGKHIAHHIFAFCVVAQHSHGQSVHTVVVVSENLFELLPVSHVSCSLFS